MADDQAPRYSLTVYAHTEPQGYGDQIMEAWARLIEDAAHQRPVTPSVLLVFNDERTQEQGYAAIDLHYTGCDTVAAASGILEMVSESLAGAVDEMGGENAT